MIITQTRQRRSFIGSLNIGEDLVASLASICVDNAIFCATFSGVGYIAAPEFRIYNHARKDFDRIAHKGTMHTVALHGNVSLKETTTVIRAHAMGELRREGTATELVSGEIVGGEVVAFEFTLNAVDDIRLYRAEDDRNGLNPWLHMDLGDGPPRRRDPALPAPAPITRPNRATPPSEPTLDGDDDEGEEIEVAIGDWIEHPTLGRCEVVDADGDERVTIRLESGRVVELRLGLLDLAKVGEDNGAQVIEVRIRRRR